MKNNHFEKETKKFSVVASLAVVVLAFLSLAVFAVVSNQDTVVSHAAGINFAGENFKFMQQNIVTSKGGFNVPLFYADSVDPNNAIFCVWHNVGTIPYGDTDPDFVAADPDHTYRYERDGEIEDYGILYLLNAVIPDLDGDVAQGYEAEVNAWIRQTAIWGYLHRTQNQTMTGPFYTNEEESFKESLKINELTSAEITSLADSTELKRMVTANDTITENPTTPIYKGAALASTKLGDSGDTTVVGKLIAEAIEYRKEVSERDGILVVNGTEVAETDDGKYFQSEISITTIPTPYEDSLKSYYLLVSKIEGIEVVTKSGEVLELTEVTSNNVEYYATPSIDPTKDKTLFVRFSSDNVDANVKTVTVLARGKIKVLNGHFYIDNLYSDDANTRKWNGKLQRVVTVTGEEKEVKGNTRLTFSKVEDTGMNTAQTIYFVGLIVLLCGIGIVYANAKPVENKQ